MKLHSTNSHIKGLTILEVLVVLFVLLLLAIVLMPASNVRRHAPGIICMSNLKQIDLGFLMYASDNGGKFPGPASATNAGTMEFSRFGHPFPQFQKVSPYLTNLDVLVCPFDKTRQPAINYATLTDSHLSYFLNADASTNHPARAILSGDRFLRVNNQPVNPGWFLLTTNLNLGWTPKVHLGFGNLAFADGHVERSMDNLNALVQNQPLPTNRLAIP